MSQQCRVDQTRFRLSAKCRIDRVCIHALKEALKIGVSFPRMRHRFKWHVSEFPYIDFDNDMTAYCLSTPTALRIVFASAARETDYAVSRTDPVATNTFVTKFK